MVRLTPQRHPSLTHKKCKLSSSKLFKKNGVQSIENQLALKNYDDNSLRRKQLLIHKNKKILILMNISLLSCTGLSSAASGLTNQPSPSHTQTCSYLSLTVFDPRNLLGRKAW